MTKRQEHGPRPAAITEVLRFTPQQAAFYLSKARFNVVPAGRRSGKTAIGKRRLVKKAMKHYGIPGARFLACAPVNEQAKRIMWRDLKLAVPEWYKVSESESERTIELKNSAIIQVVGMDEPQRAEGNPVQHVLLDEYANMLKRVWPDHIRPMLTETLGTADFTGVPEGRNHYFELFQAAKRDKTGEWATFTWFTADVLRMYLGEEAALKEIESAKATLDKLTYQQEYEAAFTSFEGRAYYSFNRDIHVVTPELHGKNYVDLNYDPRRPISLCFDFNRSPGVALVVQDHEYQGKHPKVKDDYTAVVDEFWIAKDSNTNKICHEIIQKYGHHPREVFLYGDPAGGAKHSSSLDGSDWDIIRHRLMPVFGGRLRYRVPSKAGPERIGVNCVNSRLESADGSISMLISPRCVHIVDDLDGVEVKEGTDGEIQKDPESPLTHISDALRYYMAEKHPITTSDLLDQPF